MTYCCWNWSPLLTWYFHHLAHSCQLGVKSKCLSCLPIALLALDQPFRFASSVCLVAFSFPFDQISLNLQSDWLPFVLSVISAPLIEWAVFIYTIWLLFLKKNYLHIILVLFLLIADLFLIPWLTYLWSIDLLLIVPRIISGLYPAGRNSGKGNEDHTKQGQGNPGSLHTIIMCARAFLPSPLPLILLPRPLAPPWEIGFRYPSLLTMVALRLYAL